MSARLPVVDFYAGKSVFVTGGTGFLGKVLIEKLLYSCKDVDKIYLLIRQSEEKNIEQRIEDLKRSPIFERVKNAQGDVLNKIIPVRGDIAESNLGIKHQDQITFLDKISVVFHSAATVKFNESLDVAVNLNYEATKRILNLCHRMNNLQSLVYISTAYINPQNTALEEISYPSPITDTELYKCIEQKGYHDEMKLKKILKGRPNTYTLTKAIAESYVVENHGEIPTAIVRPSVVCPAYHEPFPGWIDCWSAATAVVTTTLLGHNHIIIGNQSNVTDFIPVDYVTNACIAAAAKAASTKNLEIFNVCTSKSNPLTLKNLFLSVRQTAIGNKYNESPVFIVMLNNKTMEKLVALILEKLPSYIADSWRKVRGKRLRYMKLQARAAEQRGHVQEFTGRTWRMRAERTEALSSELTDRDAKLFRFNPRTINWPHYVQMYCAGVMKYLLKK